MHFQIIDKQSPDGVVLEADTQKEAKDAASNYFIEKTIDDDDLEPGKYEYELIVRCVIDEDDGYSETDEPFSIVVYKGKNISDRDEHFRQEDYI